MVSFRKQIPEQQEESSPRLGSRLAATLLVAAAAVLLATGCDQKPEASRIGANNQQNGAQNGGVVGAPVPNDPCYPSRLLDAAPPSDAQAAKLALASEAYEEINTKILKETCAANSCHGPESDFRPWVDNEDNFKRVAARVRFRILNKLRKHYFPADKISDDNYRLLKQYVDSIPNSDVPNGCQVDYRP